MQVSLSMVAMRLVSVASVLVLFVVICIGSGPFCVMLSARSCGALVSMVWLLIVVVICLLVQLGRQVGQVWQDPQE